MLLNFFYYHLIRLKYNFFHKKIYNVLQEKNQTKQRVQLEVENKINNQQEIKNILYEIPKTQVHIYNRNARCPQQKALNPFPSTFVMVTFIVEYGEMDDEEDEHQG